MAYSSNKAPGRGNPADPKGTLQKDAAKASGKESNQEKFSGTGARNVTPAKGGAGKRYSDTDRELGTRLQMAPNAKGTGTVKNPLNSYRSKVLAAAQNPDSIKDRAGINRAPGRRSPNSGPTV